MIKKILGALTIGCLIALLFLQNDPWLKQRVEQLFIQSFEKAGICRMTGTLAKLNLVYPCLEFTNVCIQSCSNKNWQWQAKKVVITYSWLYVLCFGSVGIHVAIDAMYSKSEYKDGQLSIMEHIMALLYSSDGYISIFIKSLEFNKAFLQVYNKAESLQLNFSSYTKIHENLLKSQVQLHQGTFSSAGVDHITDMKGSLSIDAVNAQQELDLLVQAHTTLDLAYLPAMHRQCTISGIWNKDKGIFRCIKEDGTLRIDPIKVSWKDNEFSLSMAGSMLAHDLYHLIMHKELTCRVHGSICGSTHMQYKQDCLQIEGSFSAQDIDYGSTKICNHAQITYAKKNQSVEGTIDLAYDELRAMQGSWFWDIQDQKGNVDVTNNNILAIPASLYWQLKPHAITVHADFNKSSIEGNYACFVSNDDFNETTQARGIFALKDKDFSLQGTFQDIGYEMHGIVDKNFILKSICCLDKEKKSLFTIQKDKEKHQHYKGSVTLAFIKALALARWGYELQGEGCINLDLTLDDIITAQLTLEQGTIRLPHTYNFINEFMVRGNLDMKQQKIAIEDMQGSLHRGSFSSSHAALFFDDMYRINYAYVPLLLNSCLLNLDKDLFALVSGRIACIKNEGEVAQLKSNLIIEHAQLKENIFSQEFQKNLFKTTGSVFDMQGIDMLCDITLETMTPIHIKTSLLETQAKVTMSAKNTITSPEVSGSIDLKAGTIYFPYKPLYITQGSLHFMPQNSTDPRIELTAKNTIKKHNISMMITGSVASPHIMLESSPPLTEEQIIALLLVGSPEESLNIVMPALVMQNLTSLVFGKDQSPLNLDRYFKTFLKPFKHVHLVPSFTDQTGRGGLRGAIEVDINDRWRALLQKNFNLSEDTKFELEYLLSDDVSVKGFRDERRDVGAEVEMRWKF